MYRAIVARAARRPVITAGTRLSRTYPLRWSSSYPSQAEVRKTTKELARKAALEREDDLQRDWDAKEVLYAELLPRIRSPSSVSRKQRTCISMCMMN